MTIIFLIVLFRNLKDLFAFLLASRPSITGIWMSKKVHKDEFVGAVLTFAWGLEG